MKKIVIIILSLFSIYFIYNTILPKTVPVSLNVHTNFNLEDYNVFYLDLTETDINTLNLNKKIISNIDIISITPYVNPIYKDLVGDMKYNFSNNMSLKRNVNKFTKIYKDTIKNKGYIDDLNYINNNGIKILEMEVYAKGSDIVNLIYESNIKYKTVLNGTYDYLGI